MVKCKRGVNSASESPGVPPWAVCSTSITTSDTRCDIAENVPVPAENITTTTANGGPLDDDDLSDDDMADIFSQYQ